MTKHPINIIFSLVVILFACNKENSDPKADNAVSNGSIPSENFNNLLPVEGSCIDTAGDLLFFQFPFLGNNLYPIVSAKILKALSANSYSTIFDFQGQNFSFGSWTGAQFNSQFGWIPNNSCASLAMTTNGHLYMSYSNQNTIYRITNNGYYNEWTLDRVIAISAFNNSIYVATGPSYDNSYNLSHPPRIYEIDSAGSIPTLYFEFPTSINYNNYSGGYSGTSSNTSIPLVYSMSLKMDTDTTLYVAFGYDDVIYKIDKNKYLTTYVSTIPYPTSIDIASNGIMYVASAPGFTLDSINSITMNKPPEVYTVQQGIQNKIYGGSFFTPPYFTGNSISDPMHRIGNSFYSVSVTASNKVYLVSPLEGRIVQVN